MQRGGTLALLIFSFLMSDAQKYLYHVDRSWFSKGYELRSVEALFFRALFVVNVTFPPYGP